MNNKQRILYFSYYPDGFFSKAISSGMYISQASQKFNKMVSEGFCYNGLDVDVLILCSEASSYNLKESKTIKHRTVNFQPLILSQNKIKRILLRRRVIKNTVSEWKATNGDGIVVIDALKPGALELSSICKTQGITVCTIITDLIDMLESPHKSVTSYLLKLIHRWYFYSQFRYTDVFVILTEQMREKVKIGNRKYVVIEGLSDYSACCPQRESRNNTINNTIVYTGALHKKYGVENLVKGFLSAHLPEAELWLYGTGDYVEELIEICKLYPQVKYFSPIPNDDIIDVQRNAKFLVNPRPINDEYTRYSFPSKTIEYMSSGRPVITTKLPCIPAEYYPFLFFFDDESPSGICKRLTELFCLEDDVLNQKGKDAATFIKENKNNIIQSKKILDMAKEC